MAALTPVVANTSTGGTVANGGTAASGGGDTFPRRGGDTVLHVRNGDTTASTLTFESYATPGPGEQELDLAISVPNAAERLIGPFPPEFENPATGNIEVTYSKVTSLKVDVYDIG